MAKVVSKIAIVFYELVAARVSRTDTWRAKCRSRFPWFVGIHAISDVCARKMALSPRYYGWWSPFVFSANRGNAKHQFRSLPSVSVLSSAFARHTISSFRAFAVSKTYEIVWRSRGRSFSGHEGAGASFFCTARAQCGASWYYQPVRLIESHFTFLAFSRDRSIAFPCVS